MRTESQLARFNTARALFEKLGFDDKKDPCKGVTVEKSQSGRSSRVGSESSRHSHYSSRSPSPLATERHQSAPGIRSGRSPSPNNAPVSNRGSSVDALRSTRTERKPTNGYEPKMETIQVQVVNKLNPPSSKPEPPAKTDKARISSKELIEKQKNWIQHFKGSSKATGQVQNKPALNPEAINRINSEKKGPPSTHSPVNNEKEKEAWAKERAGLLSGWMASPAVPVSPPANKESSKESSYFLSARQRFEAQTKLTERVTTTTITTSNRINQSVDNLNESFETRSNISSSSVRTVELNETASLNKSFRSASSETSVPCELDKEDSSSKNGSDLLSTDSGIVVLPVENVPATTETLIEEALDHIDCEKPISPSPTPPAMVTTPAEQGVSHPEKMVSLNNSLQENEEVFYDNSVTSARFDEWQLRTPTQLDDSPVFKSAALDFDALISDGDEAKQLEPDDEELFRTSSEMSETDLSPLSSPPPEFCKDEASPAPPSTCF